MTEPQPPRCPPTNMKELEDRVRRWKQVGYQTFSIGIDELLDIIDGYTSHSSAKSSEKVLENWLANWVRDWKTHNEFCPSDTDLMAEVCYKKFAEKIAELRQQEIKE